MNQLAPIFKGNKFVGLAILYAIAGGRHIHIPYILFIFYAMMQSLYWEMFISSEFRFDAICISNIKNNIAFIEHGHVRYSFSLISWYDKYV